jgi:hypothetical protein
MRQAIQWILANPREAEAMAERGRRQAERFSTPRCMEAIYRLADEAAARRSPVAAAPPALLHRGAV